MSMETMTEFLADLVRWTLDGGQARVLLLDSSGMGSISGLRLDADRPDSDLPPLALVLSGAVKVERWAR